MSATVRTTIGLAWERVDADTQRARSPFGIYEVRAERTSAARTLWSARFTPAARGARPLHIGYARAAGLPGTPGTLTAARARAQEHVNSLARTGSA